MRRIHAPILCGFFCLASACTPVREPKGGWTGPTDPMSTVVARINENNLAVPTLWASMGYKATVVDDRKKTHTATGDGALLYRAPRDMRLIGNKEFVGSIFEVGSVGERFWLKLVPEMDTLWWGYYRNVGRPCAQSIPIRPDLVVEVLGVSTIDTNFLNPPVPVMRFDNQRDAYVFVWNAPLPDRWYAMKEVWYDRKTLRPTLVLLYDTNGRVALRAELSVHKPVEVKGVSRERWPVVAMKYYLYFQDSGTRMEVSLREVMLDNRGTPTRRGISFPNLERAGVEHVEQIDRACEGEG